MSNTRAATIRTELARGHLALGELDETYACLARAIADDATVPGIEELLSELVDHCQAEGALVQDAAERLLADLMRARSAPSDRADWDSARPDAPPAVQPSADQRARAAQRDRLEAWITRVRARYSRDRSCREDAAHVS